MRILDIALVVVLFCLTPPAQGESTRDSDGTERESKSWEILQQATDPEIIAIRQVLEVLVQEQRPGGPADRNRGAKDRPNGGESGARTGRSGTPA